MRLARAGRAGDEHEALRVRGAGEQRLELLLVKAELGDRGDVVAAGKQPDDDFLAVH